MEISEVVMNEVEPGGLLSILSAPDVQRHLADHVRWRRKALKLSRRALAERSTVLASTIKRFETQGEISLRQLMLLWQCVDRLERVDGLTHERAAAPRTIDEVLRT